MAHSIIHNTLGAYVEFDGMTTALEAVAEVVPCQTYHIQLLVGDAVDGSYDSGVFFEASSFSTPKELSLSTQSPNNSGSIVEGCSNGAFVFTLKSPLVQDYTVNYTIQGTATKGNDYNHIPSKITIPAGSTSYVLPITSFYDNIQEGTEIIELRVPTGNCGWETVQLRIEEEQLLTAPVVNCQTLTPSTTEFSWNAVVRGKSMNSGVYAWVAEVKFKDGYTKRISGDVTLLR